MAIKIALKLRKDGSTATLAVPPGHVPSLLEANGIMPDSYPGEGADIFCNAITDWIAGDIDEKMMWRLTASRRLIGKLRTNNSAWPSDRACVSEPTHGWSGRATF